MAQAEKANQVEVLLARYMARLHTLDEEKPVKHYQSTKDNVIWIQPGELTPTARHLQQRLREALDKRFFSRYTDPAQLQRCSYVFEMQMRLHPTFKTPRSSVNRVVRLCCMQRGDSSDIAHLTVRRINERVTEKLRALMMQAAAPLQNATVRAPVHESTFSDELSEHFAPRAREAAPPVNRMRDRCDDELRRWMVDPAQLDRNGANKKESVLSF